MALWTTHTGTSYGWGGSSGYTYGQPFEPAKNIAASKIHVNIWTSTVSAKMMLYRASDGAKLAETAYKTLVSGWNTFDLPTTVALVAGTRYIIAIYSASALSFYYTSSVGSWVNQTGDDGTSFNVYQGYIYTAGDSCPTAYVSIYWFGWRLTYVTNAHPTTPTGLSPNETTTKHKSSFPVDVSFLYSDPDGHASQSYEIQYRQQGGAFVSTGAIPCVVNNNDLITHTFPPGTFNPGVTYEWQARVTDNQGGTSTWSALASFAMNALPTVTPASPKNGVKVNTRNPVPLSLNYADTNGHAQSSYEIRMRALGAVIPTFARASSAYLPDGRVVGNNIPRYDMELVRPGVENLAKNGNFARGTTSWEIGFTVSNGEAVITPTVQYQGIAQYLAAQGDSKYAGRKMYFAARIKTDSTSVPLYLNDGVTQVGVSSAGTGVFERVSQIMNVSAFATRLYIKLQDNRASGWTESRMDDVMVIDMTAHGLTNKTLAEMDALYSDWFNTRLSPGYATKQGLLIDPTAINLIPANQQKDMNALTKESFSGTITTNVVQNPLDGAIDADRINMTSGYLYSRRTLTAGATYTFSCWMRSATGANIENAGIGVWCYSGTSSMRVRSYNTITPQWKRISVTYTATATETEFSFLVAASAIKAPIDVYVWGLQLEARGHASSFTDGTRNADILTVPSSGMLFPAEGTIETFVRTPVGLPVGVHSRGLWATNGTERFDAWLVASGKFTLASPALRYSTIASSILEDGNPHLISVVWGAFGVKLYVDGVVEISTATLAPSNFGDTFYIGAFRSANYEMGGVLQSLRISSRARTAQEIADAYTAGVLLWDKDTTYALSFSDTLEPGASIGKQSGAGTSHNYPANTLKDIGDPTYEWLVRAWDSQGEPGAWSAVATFQAFQPYEVTGQHVSGITDNGGRQVPATITWTDTIPAGTSLLMECRLAGADGIWGAWFTVNKGDVITAAHRYIQYRATLTSSTDQLETPTLGTVDINYPRQYLTSGEWIGPIFDLEEAIPSATKFLADVTAAAGANVSFSVRTADDDRLNWSSWTPIASGDAYPAANFVQVRAVLETLDISKSIVLNSLVVEALNCTLRGVWISATFDATNAADKATGKITIETTTPGSSTVVALSRSSPDGLTWTPWVVAQSDGKLNHTPDNYVQVLLRLTLDGNGNRPSVQKLTLSFDGEPTTALLTNEFASGGQFYFASLLDFIAIVNGIDAPRKYDGTTLALLGGDPPRGQFIAAHKNRLWMLRGSRLYFSDLLDIDSWPILNFIDISPNDGDVGTGIYPSGDYLIITKSRSVWLLVGDSIDTFMVRRLSAVRGCLSPRSLTMVNDLLCFVSDDGVYFSDFTQTILASERLRQTWGNLNHRRLDQAVAWFHKQKLYICLPSAGSVINDTTLVFDTLREAWFTITGWGISAANIWTEAGRQVMLLGHSNEGQVTELNSGQNNAGEAIEAVWESKHNDGGYPDVMKRFRDVTFMITPDIQDVPLEIQFVVDGGPPTQPITVTIPGRPDKRTEVVRVDPASVEVDYARSLGFRVKQATKDAAVGIRAIAIYFYPLRDRPTIRG